MLLETKEAKILRRDSDSGLEKVSIPGRICIKTPTPVTSWSARCLANYEEGLQVGMIMKCLLQGPGNRKSALRTAVTLLQGQRERPLVTPQQQGSLKITPTEGPHQVTGSSGPQEITRVTRSRLHHTGQTLPEGDGERRLLPWVIWIAATLTDTSCGDVQGFTSQSFHI